jgi:hypothetical protein
MPNKGSAQSREFVTLFWDVCCFIGYTYFCLFAWHVREHTQFVCYYSVIVFFCYHRRCFQKYSYIGFTDFILDTLSRRFYEGSALETRKKPNICSCNK